MNYEAPLRDRSVKAIYVNHYGLYIGRRSPQNFRPLGEALNVPLYPTTDGMEISL